jgi:hypothetical protein
MIDPDLQRHIAYAAEELACRDGSLKERLIAAAHRLAAVLPARERWPSQLSGRAHQLENELGTLGNFEETIRGLDQAVAERLAQRILHLYADFQIAAHDARKEQRGDSRR